MTDATPLPFELPAVRTKKLTVDFDGGNQSSDAGMLLLRGAEKKTGVLARLAAALRDRRDPTRIRHRLGEIVEARVFSICAAATKTASITMHCAMIRPKEISDLPFCQLAGTEFSR